MLVATFFVEYFKSLGESTTKCVFVSSSWSKEGYGLHKDLATSISITLRPGYFYLKKSNRSDFCTLISSICMTACKFYGLKISVEVCSLRFFWFNLSRFMRCFFVESLVLLVLLAVALWWLEVGFSVDDKGLFHFGRWPKRGQ